MMAKQSGSGKSFRTGMSLVQAVRKFSDDCQAHHSPLALRHALSLLRCPCCDGHCGRGVADRAEAGMAVSEERTQGFTLIGRWCVLACSSQN